MRITTFIASITLFIAGIVLSVMDQVGAATTTYSAAVLCLVFVYLPEFKRFKGLGIEAELLEQKIEEADDLLSRLKGITVPIAEMLLSSTARMGRLGSMMPRAQRTELLDRIEAELLKAGVNTQELEQAKKDWHFYNAFDLALPTIKKAKEAFDPHLKERNEKLNKFPKPITPEKQEEYKQLIEARNEAKTEREKVLALHKLKNQSVLPDSIKSAIMDSAVLSPDEKKDLSESIFEELEDIRHYLLHKEFRRPAVWFGGDEE